MSDHESETEANATFSTNGSDPTGIAVSGEDGGDSTAFLADLARAMQTTAAAEQARNAETTEQRRQTHIDAIRAREALEAEDLRELAKDDVKGIDAWSDGEIKRVKLERERRIAARREQLQVRLEEHRSVVSREVDAVEAAIASYRADIELYFRRLESETDPVAIATLARSRPQFPALELIGPDEAPATSAYQAPSPVYAYQASTAVASPSDDSPADASTAEVPTADAPTADAEAIEAPSGEAPAADDQEAVEAVAGHGDESPSGTAEEPAADNSMVGVMDHEAGSDSPDTGWDSGSETVAEEASEPASEETAPVSEGSDATEPSDGSTEPEPVGASAEARVVMPRSTGTGSWLRWPNSSADRSDQPR